MYIQTCKTNVFNHLIFFRFFTEQYLLLSSKTEGNILIGRTKCILAFLFEICNRSVFYSQLPLISQFHNHAQYVQAFCLAAGPDDL